MEAKYDDATVQVTPEFIAAIKELMRQKILMMRKAQPEYKHCWVVGAARIGDLSNASGLSLTYGGYEEEEWMKENADVFVKVPLRTK